MLLWRSYCLYHRSSSTETLVELIYLPVGRSHFSGAFCFLQPVLSPAFILPSKTIVLRTWDLTRRLVSPKAFPLSLVVERRPACRLQCNTSPYSTSAFSLHRAPTVGIPSPPLAFNGHVRIYPYSTSGRHVHTCQSFFLTLTYQAGRQHNMFLLRVRVWKSCGMCHGQPHIRP